jgi:predicted nucleic-acid-binding protein
MSERSSSFSQVAKLKARSMITVDWCSFLLCMSPTSYFTIVHPLPALLPWKRWIGPSDERWFVVAFDTNVLVRVLVGDDPAQTKKAERAFAEHAKGDGVFVSLIVLAEIGWVLSVAYQWDRGTILDRLSRLVRTRGVLIEDLELVDAALEGYRGGKAELADYLILGKAQDGGAKLLTFDKRLSREVGVTLL